MYWDRFGCGSGPSDPYLRIREAQKQTDPTDPDLDVDQGTVSHQWCDLFHGLLHSYTRHIERGSRGERDIVPSTQDGGHA